jgi:hypothetical protein
MSRNQIIQFPQQIRTFSKSLSEHPLLEGVPKVDLANHGFIG